MTRILFRRLLFIIAVSITLYSCMHDEVISSADQPTSKDYASKSPWKEDQVYIKKVQQVFLQNANVTYFEKKYGKVHWDYAMSLGTFDESYLVVPVLKDNEVVTVMKVYRIDDRVYFHEKNDPEFIDFFNDVMFKNITGTDEKTIFNNTSLESKTLLFKCTYRTISIGCPEGYDDCGYLPGRTISECRWTETDDNTPPIMQLCDPMECGGGGGGGPEPGFNYPEPPENPCEKISTVGKKDKTKGLFENLKKKTNSTKEFGEILKESGGQINNTSIEGEVGQGGIDLNFSGGPIDGFIHSHYTGLLSVFSPGDLASLAALYATGNIKDVNTFIMGVVTASETQYIMVIDDPAAFAAFGQQFLLPNGQINDTLTDLFGIIQYGKYNIKNNNLSTTNELGFLKLLNDYSSGLKILKGSNNSNTWAELNIKNGQIDPKPCN